MKPTSIAISFGLLFVASVSADAQKTPVRHAGGGQFQAYHEETDRLMNQMLGNLVGDTANPEPEAQSPFALAPGSTELEPPQPVGNSLVQVSGADSVAVYADRFWNGRLESLRGALGRMNRIRPSLEGILAEEDVPARFAAVVLVESGANPEALSPKAARGLWQLLPDTARRYGLVVNQRQDDRIDLIKSTRAAARYLHDLYRVFGNWRLTLAAYNAGEGAIRQAIRHGGSFDFQSLSDRKLIPAETTNYVPAVLAAVNLLDLQGSSAMP
ncbi:MAG: lytic transglycosylase domain-containing protein [Acidobacteriota bacterium]|nr:lytic transglycosylase domain-containing protein [Acidobacteriota bacterium]